MTGIKSHLHPVLPDAGKHISWSNLHGSGLGINIADLTLRGFNRDQESAADDFGLEIVQAEYGHVNASWRFFDRLIDDDLGVSGLATYLATHPSADDRIEDLQFRAQTRGWLLNGTLTELAWGRGNSAEAR